MSATNSSATAFSTTQTGSAMQRMPAQPKVELMMPRAARSSEASASTRPWFLACVCAWTRLPWAAAME